MRLIAQTTGTLTEISIYETADLYGEKGNFRIMQFSGEAIQGAIDLDRPERIVFEYPRAIIHLMKQNAPSFEEVFAIGHGIGTIAGYFADKRFKVAELDEQVVELSRAWFGSSGEDIVIGDGRRLLSQEKADTYDFIILDAFTDQGTPRHLVTSGFFQTARAKLHADGSILMNLIGKGDNDSFVQAIHTTLAEAFPYTKTFCIAANRTTDAVNVVMMGSGKPIRFQTRHMAGFRDYDPAPGYVIMDESV